MRHDRARRGRWATALMGGPERSATERSEGCGNGCPAELGRPNRKRERGEEKVGERTGGESWASRPK